jgi:thiamine biosynthesis lipoprotein
VTYKQNIHLVFALLLLLGIPQANAAWVKKTAAVMGTHIAVELWHPNKVRAEQLAQEVIDEMWRIDLLMSPFREESELSRINRLASQTPLHISQETYQLLERARHFSDLSEGAFDITYASVGRLYDYRAALRPDQEKIESLLPTINYQHLILASKAHTVAFAVDGVKIDLGGIAKGHAVDGAIELLKRAGVEHALVTAGGDSRILGDRKGRPWHVAIRNPRDKKSTVVLLPLINSALSTSGDYERYFEADGVRYHHIITPQTGDSPRQLRSVTVIGEDATTTDALSTTLFVLGLEKGMALIESLPNIDAIIIDNKGKMHYSKGLGEPSS